MSQIKGPASFWKIYKNLDIILLVLSNVCYDFDYTRFEKISDNFWTFAHYYILFLSTSGVVSVKTEDNQFPVCYKPLTVLYSTNGFYILYYGFWVFLLILIVIAYFMSSFCFLVGLSQYWTVHLEKGIVEKMYNVGKRRIWICYLFLLNSLCFLGWELSRRILWVYLFFPYLSFFSLLCVKCPIAIDLYCFPKTYNST